MAFKHYAASALAAVLVFCTANAAQAASVYLNHTNMTVALGASMAPNPFANVSTAQSLANIIDLDSASDGELHNQSTHVWVSGGSLELDFDFGIEYNLEVLHFWNYHSEAFDVDNIDFTFYDGSGGLVGSLLGIEPALGNATGSDSDPIFAEHYTLDFPLNVRFVNAILTGSNGQVDFNNLGFTGSLSNPIPSEVPIPGAIALFWAGLAGLGYVTRRRKRA